MVNPVGAKFGRQIRPKGEEKPLDHDF